MKKTDNDQVLRDALTGLYTRGAFDERFKLELDRSEKYKLPLSIMFMDLDHFKSINDGFGHQRGDEVLKTFSQRLKTSVRYTDLLFRYGGDEFVIVLPETAKTTAIDIAARILQEIMETPFSGEPPLSISTSIGIASYPEDATGLEELLLVADDRQYNAKREGRGRAVSEDTLTPTHFSLEEPSRLLERDLQNETVKSFFEKLIHRHAGILQIIGEEGSGKTRFLDGIRDKAKLQGYVILDIEGQTSTRNRYFGSISEAVQDWRENPKMGAILNELPLPSQDCNLFILSLLQKLKDDHSSGLLICAEKLHFIDRASQSCIQKLLRTFEQDEHTPLPVALVYTMEETAKITNALFDAPLHESVILKPISLAGIRIWIRHSLQWEANDTFLNWFYQETAGLPKNIQNGLSNLIQNKQLILNKHGWQPSTMLDGYPLKSHLSSSNPQIKENLPVNQTEFIGREKEIQDLKSLLMRNDCIAITGPGGHGKTRLAIQAAAESIQSYPDGIYYIDLTEVKTRDALLNHIENTLQIDTSGSENLTQELFRYLNDKTMLLIFDSYNYLINETDLIADILDEAFGVKILITVQERLDSFRILNFELKGLNYPVDEHIEHIEGYSSVILFYQCAQRINPDFLSTEENNRYVIKICQMLGGSPLGIELAAAWIHTFTPKEIYFHIYDNIRFLNSDRYQSNNLLIVLDSFWNYLFTGEQKTLEKLSVFNGGFNREAAGFVAGASPFFLDSLAHKSYLSRSDRNRYHIHELLRHYSTDKLEEDADDYSSVHHKHCRYFADFLKQKESELKGPKQKHALDDIHQEIENIRLAWNWAIINKDVDFLSSSLDALFMFYDMRSWFKEGEESFKLLQTIWLTEEDKTIEPFKGKSIARQGWFTFHLGRLNEAEDLFEQSLSLLTDYPFEMIFSLNYRAAIAMHRADFELAQKLIEKSIEKCQITEAIYERGIAHNISGRIYHLTGNYDEAQNQYRQSLSFSRKLNNPWSIAYTTEYLGEIAFIQGHFEEAKSFYESCLQTRREIMDQRGIAISLNLLGMTTQALEDYHMANQYFHEAFLIFESIGNSVGIIQSQLNLASNSRLSGDDNQALEIYGLALKSSTSIDSIPDQIKCLIGVAEVWVEQKHYLDAYQIIHILKYHPQISHDSLESIQDLVNTISASIGVQNFQKFSCQVENMSFEQLLSRITEKSIL